MLPFMAIQQALPRLREQKFANITLVTSVLGERAGDYFDLNAKSPYMLIVAPVKEERRIPMTEEQKQLFGIEKLNVPRSELPAITHVDGSARLQTVDRELIMHGQGK